MASGKKKSWYKYCIVPNCTNTTSRTPEKIFFYVPLQKEKREKWCKVMNRDVIGPKSIKYVCEDHFDIENDTENLIRYKLVGGKLRLKSDVCPHKFSSKTVVKKPTPPKDAYVKRAPSSSTSQQALQPFEVIMCDSLENDVKFNVSEDPLFEDCPVKIPNNSKQSFRRKQVSSVNPKDTQQKLVTEDRVNIPKDNPKKRFKPNDEPNRASIKQKVSQENQEVPITVKKEKTDDAEDSYFGTTQSPPSSSTIAQTSVSANLTVSKPQYYIDTIMKISTNVGFYLGLPEDIYFLTDLLSASTASSVRDILVTLKKIHLNDSFVRLAIDFELSENLTCEIFHKTTPVVASRMKQLFFFPPVKKICEKLPISFRKSYFKTVSIVDYFEIRIKKPSSAVQQALTWSEGKHCNTFKYLISVTPDGLINFISDGYGGRASDTVVFEDCDFLQKLTTGCSVMAGSGFENISHFLEAKGCHLIRPPCFNKDEASEMEIKRSQALRFNTERTINKLRNFSMLASHACLDTELIYLLDYIVVIVCGIVNVQSKLTDT